MAFQRERKVRRAGHEEGAEYRCVRSCLLQPVVFANHLTQPNQLPNGRPSRSYSGILDGLPAMRTERKAGLSKVPKDAALAVPGGRLSTKLFPWPRVLPMNANDE